MSKKPLLKIERSHSKSNGSHSPLPTGFVRRDFAWATRIDKIALISKSYKEYRLKVCSHREKAKAMSPSKVFLFFSKYVFSLTSRGTLGPITKGQRQVFGFAFAQCEQVVMRHLRRVSSAVGSSECGRRWCSVRDRETDLRLWRSVQSARIEGGMNEWWSEWMKEWTNESWNEWMMEWMNDGQSVWMKHGMNEWWSEWMMGSEWMKEWMNEGVNEWNTERMMEKWRIKSINVSKINPMINGWMDEERINSREVQSSSPAKSCQNKEQTSKLW